MSLTGLSKFKEGVSKIQELLSLRKGINLHLQEIEMDYPKETKRQSFLAVKTNSWAGFQGKPSVKWREWSNGRLKDKSYNFQGERNFIIDRVIKISSAEL